MPKIACTCLLTLMNLLCFCLISPPAQADDPPTREHQQLSPCTYIPLKRGALTEGQPVIVGTINGNSARFMADTGASSCVLSPEMAKQLNLMLEPAFLDNGEPSFWKGKQITEALVFGFKVSNVTLASKLPFQVLPDQDFMLDPQAPDDTRFDGVVGANLLEHFAVLVDASQHQFGLCLPGNLYLKQVANYGLKQPYIVPMEKKDDGRWYVEAQVVNDGITALEAMVLDTGSNITQISDTTAQALHLKINGQQQQVNSYRTRMVGVSSVETLRFGDLNLSGPSVVVSPISTNEPPILGMNILSHFRVLIDFPGGKMYLQLNTAAAVPAITVGPAPAPAMPPAK